MMELKKVDLSGLGRFFSGDFRLKIIVILGLIGMLLILVSQLTDREDSLGGQPQSPSNAQFTNEEYVMQLEERLQNLISQIDGVGRNQVMVTLESGARYVYAQEERRSVDTTREGDGEIQVSGRVSESIEQRFILVDTDFGRREALVLTRLPPRVQGVVIVCEGANNPVVEQKLISVITTALGIPSTRVSVVPIT